MRINFWILLFSCLFAMSAGNLLHIFSHWIGLFPISYSMSSVLQVPESAIFFIEDGKKVPAAWIWKLNERNWEVQSSPGFHYNTELRPCELWTGVYLSGEKFLHRRYFFLLLFRRQFPPCILGSKLTFLIGWSISDSNSASAWRCVTVAAVVGICNFHYVIYYASWTLITYLYFRDF